MQAGITLGHGVLWVLVWVGFMLFYTLVDVALWRRALPAYAKYLHVITIMISIAAYLCLLARADGYQVDLLRNASLSGALMALGCALLLYGLLDRGLDPILERCFPASEKSYQESLRTLSKAPVASLIQVCVLAPVIEEILMRDFLLRGLSAWYGNAVALLVSSAMFALLHFNMVQTLSALICGLVLGLLYMRTGSVGCCILAHAGYNLVSYLTMIVPLFRK